MGNLTDKARAACLPSGTDASRYEGAATYNVSGWGTLASGGSQPTHPLRPQQAPPKQPQQLTVPTQQLRAPMHVKAVGLVTVSVMTSTIQRNANGMVVIAVETTL